MKDVGGLHMGFVVGKKVCAGVAVRVAWVPVSSLMACAPVHYNTHLNGSGGVGLFQAGRAGAGAPYPPNHQL